MLKTEIIENTELPYRIQIDKLQGAGITPAKAAIAALRVGGKVPRERCHDGKDAAAYLFWHYEPNPDWVKLISILENDSFKIESDIEL